jgi:DNA-directed RNA polymerase specialized sigma24 family protein
MKNKETEKIDRKNLLSKVCKIANKIPRTTSRKEAFLTAWKMAKNDCAEIKAAKQKTEFDNYVNMIRSRAHYYAKCYNMDYADVEAQGFLIYCISLKDYNKKRASFSTFLYRNLSGRLLDYCKIKTKKEKHDCRLSEIFNLEDENTDIGFDIFAAREAEPNTEQLLSYAKCYLTSGAYKILKWLLNDRLAEFRSRANPSLVSIAKTLNIKVDLLKIYWQELFDFLDLRGATFYASN